MRRGFEVACVVAAIVLTAVFWLVDDGARLLVMAVWIVVGVASGGALLVAGLSATRSPEQRPQRFILARRGFRAPPHPDLRRALGPLVLIVSGFLAMMIDGHNWFLLVVIAAPIAGVLRNMRRTTVTLTPAGVTIAGCTLAWGEPTQVPRELAVNPWFVSAAIQWYANHPDERLSIGTPEGHERLREALGAVDPVEPPAPPLPRNLVLASWFTGAGVGAAVLSAIGDVVLAIVFRSALERPDPMYPDSGDDWEFIAGSTVVWLVVAVLIGFLAIGVLHAVRRSRSDFARVLLAVLAGMAIASAGCPIGSPILALADIEGVVGMIVLCGWMAGKAAVAGPAVGALTLLVSAPVRAYTRPPAPAAVGAGVRA